MYEFFKNLDRRWIFLLMLLAVLIPLLAQVNFPEETSPMVRNVFHAIDDIPAGSRVLMAFDYDPGSRGELDPMAAAFTRHCAEKGHKIYFITTWPFAGPMIQRAIDILDSEYPDLIEGEDYVNFGFKAGNEAVIKAVAVDLTDMVKTDATGTSYSQIPMCRNIKSLQDMDLVINVSAGDPGTKQWVQYATTPYDINLIAGCTGVQAPTLYPYIPHQMIGLLGAIKGAAEYEQILIEHYPKFADNAKAKDGLRRMGPQLVGHVLIVFLVIMANVIYFIGRRRGDVQ